MDVESPFPEFSAARRALLQAGGATALLAVLPGCDDPPAPLGLGHAMQKGHWRNWSGSQASRPAAYATPRNEAELLATLRAAPAPVRVAGASHSFSGLVNTDATLVSLDQMAGLRSHDAQALQATVSGGSRIRDLGEPLAAIGQGFINQGDVDPQSIAGAMGTATHGTGATLGSFSSLATALRLVTPNGEAIDCSAEKDAEVFRAACTSLGALGAASEVTLQNRSAYRLRERTYTAPYADVLAGIGELARAHRHFEFFMFFGADDVLVKTLDLTDEPDSGPGLELPVDAVLWAACEVAHGLTALDGLMQRFLTALSFGSEPIGPSHRIFPSQRNVRFNEMEYELPAGNGPACLDEVRSVVRRSGIATLFPVEYRLVAAEESWLSPFHGRDSASISVHQYADVDWRPLFAVAEPILRRHGGRPHWGKLHTMTARELEAAYPRWSDFQRVRARLDPEGRMLNDHLRTVLGVAA